MTTRRATVLIDNHNYADFVGAAIESALAQGPEVEVIVVDDGSTDNSLAVIQAYADRVRVVAKPNGGQASAFNAGIAVATGAVVFLLDADDVFHPGKVDRVLRDLDQLDGAGWAAHPLRRVEVATPPPVRGVDGPIAMIDVRRRLRWWGTAARPALPATSGLAFSRVLLDAMGPVPEGLRITADNFLKLAALPLAQGVWIADELADQLVHGRNLYTEAAGATADHQRLAVQLAVARGLLAQVPATRREALRMVMGTRRSLDEQGDDGALTADVAALIAELRPWERWLLDAVRWRQRRHR